MPMTLLEALQTDEVKAVLDTRIQESVDAALPAAVEARVEELMPSIREAVRAEMRAETQVDDLAAVARGLIESARGLTPAARANLLTDYGVTTDGDERKAGRALALVEARVDDGGKIVESAEQALRKSVEGDIDRTRAMLREAAPTVPTTPAGDRALRESGGGQPVAQFGGESSPWAQRLRERGIDPTTFGATKPPTTT